MSAVASAGGRVRVAIILVMLMPSLLAPEVVDRAVALGTANGGTYYPSGQATLLFVILPLVTLSAFVLFLLPGVLLASAMGKTSTIPESLFYGFVLSLVVVCLMSGVAQALVAHRLLDGRGPGFGAPTGMS